MADRHRTRKPGSNARPNGRKNPHAQESHTCVICSVKFTGASDKLIECERGRSWNCASCCGYSDQDYQILTKRIELHWYCEKCLHQAIMAVQTERDIEERCNHYLSKVTKRIDSLELKVNSKADQTAVASLEARIKKVEESTKSSDDMQETPGLDKIRQEVKGLQDNIQDFDTKDRNHLVELEKDKLESERRKSNLIMFKVPEAMGENAETRKLQDIATVNEALQKIDVSDIKPKAVNRIGKKSDDKVRPLLIALPSEENKTQILRKLHEMRQSQLEDNKNIAKSIQVAPDRTPKERTEYKKLKAELDERTQKGEENLVIRRNKIVVRNPFRRPSEREDQQ